MWGYLWHGCLCQYKGLYRECKSGLKPALWFIQSYYSSLRSWFSLTFPSNNILQPIGQNSIGSNLKINVYIDEARLQDRSIFITTAIIKHQVILKRRKSPRWSLHSDYCSLPRWLYCVIGLHLPNQTHLFNSQDHHYTSLLDGNIPTAFSYRCFS